MESDFSDFTNGEVAQQVEQETENLRVADSISALSTDRLYKWREIDGGTVLCSGTCIGVIKRDWDE
jgi:hypothetical protein